MIQSNQIRIGNYLLNTCRDSATIVKVNSIDKHHIGCTLEGVKVDLCYNFENYIPVPLTGRIVNNFGANQALKIGSNNDGFFYYTSNGRFVKLDYLHQLQNLYFALTGEEISLDMEAIIAEHELSLATA